MAANSRKVHKTTRVGGDLFQWPVKKILFALLNSVFFIGYLFHRILPRFERSSKKKKVSPSFYLMSPNPISTAHNLVYREWDRLLPVGFFFLWPSFTEFLMRCPVSLGDPMARSNSWTFFFSTSKQKKRKGDCGRKEIHPAFCFVFFFFFLRRFIWSAVRKFVVRVSSHRCFRRFTECFFFFFSRTFSFYLVVIWVTGFAFFFSLRRGWEGDPRLGGP